MTSNLLDRIKSAYQELADHTKPKCASCKPKPFNCCATMFCELAEEHALNEYGIKLERLTHDPKLPFMGPQGCTVEPYLRPICTVHTCDINSLGFARDDPKWTKAYFKLRDKVSLLEYSRMRKSKKGPL